MFSQSWDLARQNLAQLCCLPNLLRLLLSPFLQLCTLALVLKVWELRWFRPVSALQTHSNALVKVATTCATWKSANLSEPLVHKDQRTISQLLQLLALPRVLLPIPLQQFNCSQVILPRVTTLLLRFFPVSLSIILSRHLLWCFLLDHLLERW